jgi:hypothetical protein
MTRETKIGLVVTTTFLCLVGLVVASKLRPPEVVTVEPLEGEPSEPFTDTTPPPPPAVAQASPQAPAPASTQASAPASPAANPPAAPTIPAPIAGPPPLTTSPSSGGMGDSAVSLPAVALPKVEGASGKPPSITPPPTQASGAEVTIPVIEGKISLPEAVASTGGQNKLPVGVPQQSQPQQQAPLQLPQIEPPAKSGEVAKPSGLPEVAKPTTIGDPPTQPMPMSGQAKQEMPPVIPAPLEKKDPPPVKTEVSFPMPAAPTKSPFSEPTPNPPLPDPNKGKGEATVAVPPLVAPAPISPALTGTTTGDAKPAQAVQQPQQQQTKSNLPPITNIPPAKTESIGTIGPATGDTPTTPAIAPGKPAVVPSKPASVRKFSDDRYVCQTATTFDKLSETLYGSPKYGKALHEYNRQHLLTAQATNLNQESPVLPPGQAVYYPHQNILEIEYGRYIQVAAAAPPAASQAQMQAQAQPLVKISPPTPLTNPPTSDPTVSYKVPQNEHICAIAARTLGDYKKWDEILRLNPWLDRMDVNQIPAGTVLRLPASARVN